VFAGDSKRLIYERNLAMEMAWQTARLTAYAPEKGKDFIKLDKLLHREKPKGSPVPWEDKLAQVKAWVGSFRKRG